MNAGAQLKQMVASANKPGGGSGPEGGATTGACSAGNSSLWNLIDILKGYWY